MYEWSDWQAPVVMSVTNPYTTMDAGVHNAGTDVQYRDGFFLEPWHEDWQTCAHTHMAVGSGFDLYADVPTFSCPTPVPGSRPQNLINHDRNVGTQATSVTEGPPGGLWYQHYRYVGQSQRISYDLGELYYRQAVDATQEAIDSVTDPLFSGVVEFEVSEDYDYNGDSLTYPTVDITDAVQTVSVSSFRGSWTMDVYGGINSFDPGLVDEYGFIDNDLFWDDWWNGKDASVITSITSDTSVSLDLDLTWPGGTKSMNNTLYSLWASHSSPETTTITDPGYLGSAYVYEDAYFGVYALSVTVTTSNWRYLKYIPDATYAPPLRMSQRDDGVRGAIRLSSNLTSSSTQDQRAPRIGSGNRYS